MGAKPEDYERSAPYRSYIHVDEFASPKELAGYLHRLDKNDDLYNSYFRYNKIKILFAISYFYITSTLLFFCNLSHFNHNCIIGSNICLNF